MAPVSNNLWRTLYNLAKEQGKHVRRNWGSTPSSLELTPPRCADAALVTPAAWSVLFGYRFRASDHINVPELTAPTSLVRHLANRGARRQRILCCVHNCVVLGAVSKGRSSSRRLNFGLAFDCLSASLSIDLLVVPSWGNPDATWHLARHLATFAWQPEAPVVRFVPLLLPVSSTFSVKLCPRQPFAIWELATSERTVDNVFAIDGPVSLVALLLFKTRDPRHTLLVLHVWDGYIRCLVKAFFGCRAAETDSKTFFCANYEGLKGFQFLPL